MAKLKHQVSSFEFEAGCDEAGRGCLAGPVVAAAVILPRNFKHPLLNDSKQLTEKQRALLRPIIEENAIAWAVAVVGPREIEEINIRNASFIGMHRAVEALKIKPEFIAVDGNAFITYPDIPHECIIKGDGKIKNIAAASILAKTHRDEIMEHLDLDFPEYKWKKNKGYPTKDHRDAIASHGACVHHRTTFALLPKQLKLEL
ncbi:MAG: ribonuclease HII [Flavobacteriales bacterium]